MIANMLRWLVRLAPVWLLVAASAGTARLSETEPQAASSFEDRADAVPAVVVMVLSPRMVYAFSEWPRMKRAAEQAGFVVQSVRDPRIGDREWRAAALAAGRPEALDLPLLDAAALAGFPELLNHSPTSLVRSAGRVHPWPITGVMPDAAWTALLRQRLDQLRAAR